MSFRFFPLKVVLAGLVVVACALPAVAAEAEPFGEWLSTLKREARERGISASTLDTAFAGVAPIPRIIELDRRQPELTLTFWKYLNGRVTEKRIRRGKELLVKHRTLLDRVARKYGVQPRFLVAFWGLETNFGDYFGAFPVTGALATLAHDPRRDRFFREQLLALLGLMDRGDIPFNAKSSWAGAMGHCQFMPTTYRQFAVDFDGDGKRNMWRSLPDALASAANFLGRSGWMGDRTWGREVRLPGGFDWRLAGLKVSKSLAGWQKLGVRRMDGRDLPKVDIAASILLPAGHKGPAFLVYKNFRTILVWNRSLLYALSVGHLADRLAGFGPFLSPRPDKEIPLSRGDVLDLQRLLQTRGYHVGTPDGVIGPKTRAAIRTFQKSARLPVDGYADFGLLERLRGRLAGPKAGG